jgi:tetratricopeptide (TPR) repeat protein
LQLRRHLGNPVDIAATLSTLSLARLQRGDVLGATECEEEALRLFRQLGDRSGEMIGLLHVGQIALYADHADSARTNLENALATARELKQQEVQGESELLLGEVALGSADFKKAELWFKRSLTVCREAADRRGEANALRSLARCDLFNGDLITARSRLIPALQAFKSSEMWEELFSCLEDFARLRRAEGEADAAVRLLASTAAARQRLALVHPPRAARAIQSLTEELKSALGSDRFKAAWSEGSSWDVEEAVRVARTIESEARFPA